MSKVFDKLSVEITQDGCSVQIDKNTNREISHEDFLSLYSGVMGKEVEEVKDSFVLPSGVMNIARGKSQLTLTCYYPSSKRRLHYVGADDKAGIRMEIMTPNIIISHRLKQDKSTKDWLVEPNWPRYFCTDLPAARLPKEWIESHSYAKRIWVNPFTNTYQDGHMCTGHNTMPVRFTEGNLRGLDWYYGFMWESPFNRDLGLYGLGNTVGVLEWYRILEKAAAEDRPFPYTYLPSFQALPT